MKINSYTLQVAFKMFKCLCVMSKKLSTSSSHRFQLVLKTVMILKKRKYSNKSTRHKTPTTQYMLFLEMPTEIQYYHQFIKCL